MFCHPIPVLDHLNVLSYADVLRRDANVGDWVAIIGSGGVGFDAKRWTEDWRVNSTNKARSGAAATLPHQKDKERERGMYIVLMQIKVGKLGNLGRTTG